MFLGELEHGIYDKDECEGLSAEEINAFYNFVGESDDDEEDPVSDADTDEENSEAEQEEEENSEDTNREHEADLDLDESGLLGDTVTKVCLSSDFHLMID